MWDIPRNESKAPPTFQGAGRLPHGHVQLEMKLPTTPHARFQFRRTIVGRLHRELNELRMTRNGMECPRSCTGMRTSHGRSVGKVGLHGSHNNRVPNSSVVALTLFILALTLSRPLQDERGQNVAYRLGNCALTCVEFTQLMGLGLIACRTAISGNTTSIRHLLFATADDVRRSATLCKPCGCLHSRFGISS